MINFDEILKGLTLILTNAVATLPQKEKDLAMNYLAGLKARMDFDIKQLANEQLSLSAVIARLENEPQIIISQVESLGVVAVSDIEDAANDAIDLLIASIPTVTVEGETKAAFDTQSTYSKAVGVSPNTIPDSKLTTYGLFIAGELSPADTIAVARKLGCTAIRTGLNMDTYTLSKAAGVQQFIRAGFDVYLNINWKTIRDGNGQRSPQPWVNSYEMDSYKSRLTNILIDCKGVKCVTLENEETNNIYHSGDGPGYVVQLAAASEICRSMGITITNGGLTNPGLQIACYRWLVTNNKTVEAKDFYDKCMDSRTKKAAKYRGTNKDLDAKADETAYLLSNYGKLVDFVNFHWYEPLIKSTGILGFNFIPNNTSSVTPGALKQVSSYIRSMTGLDAISNEVGITNENEKLVTSVLKDFAANNIKTLVWFSATSENGTTDPLNDGTDLNSLGIEFANFVK
jgi:hypothetical protein